MSPLVSIIMPAYNAEAFIVESIESVLAQSFKNWELVIIDDGSTDATADICKQFQKKDERIKYFYQPNAKQGKARSKGVLNSTGNILAFLDADDLWEHNKLELSLKTFVEADHDLLFTDAFVFTNSHDLKNIAHLNRLGITPAYYEGKEGLAAFLYKNKIPMLTVLVKKEAVLAVGGFSPRGVAEDYELWLKLLSAGYVFRSIDACLSFYRVHEDATTSADKLAVHQVAEMFGDFFKDKPELKVSYRSQIKGWLRRYLELHDISKRKDIQIPSIFQDFKTYILQYRLLVASRNILPTRLYNMLYRHL